METTPFSPFPFLLQVLESSNYYSNEVAVAASLCKEQEERENMGIFG
jgi:hypothetical protein